jgi:PII-like signaling protein
MSEIAMLRIVVRRGAQHRHHGLALDLISRAHEAGLAGATMVEVVAGFGSARRTRMSGRWALSDAVAYQILIVDTEDKIDRFLDQIRSEIAQRGLVTKEPVTAITGRITSAQA